METVKSALHQHSGHKVFEILVSEHADMLSSYLRSLVRSSDLVDDLFQDTMMTAWRRLDDYDHDRPFGPWLRGIAIRLVLKQRERLARDLLLCHPEVLEALERRYDELAHRDESFSGTRDRLMECLRRLPSKIRAAIAMTYEQDLLRRHVAQRLGVSEEAVKKRVQRGRRLLAECLRHPEAMP